VSKYIRRDPWRNRRHLDRAGEPIARVDFLNLKAMEKIVNRPTANLFERISQAFTYLQTLWLTLGTGRRALKGMQTLFV